MPIDGRGASPAPALRGELETARRSFHGLLERLDGEDRERASLNPGWTNGEILAHMLFGFIILDALLPLARFWARLPPASSKPFARLLNALTGPFNWINALGARGQGKIFKGGFLERRFDRVCDRLIRRLDSIKPVEWGRGMHYPTRWDPNFSEFMTLEKLFHYPIDHFRFHLRQIAFYN